MIKGGNALSFYLIDVRELGRYVVLICGPGILL